MGGRRSPVARGKEPAPVVAHEARLLPPIDTMAGPAVARAPSAGARRSRRGSDAVLRRRAARLG
jgi:hypothetical protein